MHTSFGICAPGAPPPRCGERTNRSHYDPSQIPFNRSRVDPNAHLFWDLCAGGAPFALLRAH